ncbi:uncharacterized protein LOC113510038 [Galleria mellonella]|uniref:Uncharacterized protein LOC113510038 n=1 Tax=Galleria mellonella TaxID=7137 RepID=A0A6J1W8R7_GALME|nr:uncharacterized protein LOC113510038 [Galleria mellonella]
MDGQRNDNGSTPASGLQAWYVDFDGWVSNLRPNENVARLIHLQQMSKEPWSHSPNTFYLQNAIVDGIFLTSDTKKLNEFHNSLKFLKNNTGQYELDNGVIRLTNGNVMKYSCIYKRSKLLCVVLFY